MPKVLTLDEIGELNPHINVDQMREWQQLRNGLPNNGSAGRFRRTQPGRDVRVHIDDRAESDSRTVKLQRY